MSSTTQTRPRTRSKSNANLVNCSALEVVEKATCAKNSKKGKVAEKKRQTTVTLGQIAWDQMFIEGELALATKKFMEKLSKAISDEDFETINNEVNKTMQGEKDNFCSQSYRSLNEARDELYSLYTETLREEVGFFLNADIKSLQHEKGQIKTKMGQMN